MATNRHRLEPFFSYSTIITLRLRYSNFKTLRLIQHLASAGFPDANFTLKAIWDLVDIFWDLSFLIDNSIDLCPYQIMSRITALLKCVVHAARVTRGEEALRMACYFLRWTEWWPSIIVSMSEYSGSGTLPQTQETYNSIETTSFQLLLWSNKMYLWSGQSCHL